MDSTLTQSTLQIHHIPPSDSKFIKSYPILISRKALGNNTNSINGSVLVSFYQLGFIYHFTTIVHILPADEYRYSVLLSANLSQFSNEYIIGFLQCTFNFVPGKWLKGFDRNVGQILKGTK